MKASDNFMTLENIVLRPSRSEKTDLNVQQLKIISFTHKTISLTDLSKFYVDESIRMEHLAITQTNLRACPAFYLQAGYTREVLAEVKDVNAVGG